MSTSELLRLRIGTTLLVRLPLQINGETVSLNNYDLTVFLVTPRKKRIDLDFEIDGEDEDIIKFTYEGKDQDDLGLYRLEVYINYKDYSMAAYDRDAFVLVPFTAYENDGVEDIGTASLTLSSGTMLVSANDGVGIDSIVNNADYSITINLTDGTSYTTPSLLGNQGVGISRIVQNADYTLTITLTDGVSYTTTDVRGARGPQGDDYVLTSADKQEIADLISEEAELLKRVEGSTTYQDF